MESARFLNGGGAEPATEVTMETFRDLLNTFESAL